jgi:quercetin dioxygenase-like cupin family protein
MRVVRAGEVAGQAGTTFTGPVEMRRLVDSQQTNGTSVSLVRFEDGARTNWHVHPGEQILIVVEGEGRVGNGTEEYAIGQGDVVYCQPNERHWHGAQPGKTMAHFSITTIGPAQWFEAPAE